MSDPPNPNPFHDISDDMLIKELVNRSAGETFIAARLDNQNNPTFTIQGNRIMASGLIKQLGNLNDAIIMSSLAQSQQSQQQLQLVRAAPGTKI